MLDWVTAGSPVALGMLVFCLLLAIAFEFSNGFHDTANAVATVIYTNSLKPVPAVIWSGCMNFLGVMLGGIAVAYALVEILPAEVLAPPNGNPAVGMLASLFLSALVWNVGTWVFGIPNSSSHALIGSLVGISIASVIKFDGSLHQNVDWSQIVKVLEALLISPLIGFFCAAALYWLVRKLIRDEHLYKPPEGDTPPVWWMRAILILTCTGVSFSHGTNDGQKSIGLIMLTVIGLAPATFAVDRQLDPAQTPALVAAAAQAAPLIARDGDAKKGEGVAAATAIAQQLGGVRDLSQVPEGSRVRLRNNANRVITELKEIAQGQGVAASDADKAEAKALQKTITGLIRYAPWWVRILSAVTLALGTMVGYQRIVKTLGERLGKQHLAPAQGGSAELVSALVIGVAGVTGAPVSTTHVVTSGIAGTMAAAGAGVQGGTVKRIIAAWVLTLPATILMSGGLFLLLS